MTCFLRSFPVALALWFVCFASFSANAQQAPYFKWTKALQGYHTSAWVAYNWGSSIKSDAKGNVFITGTFARSVDFDPLDKGVDSQACYSNFGCYFARYDSMGLHNWAKVIPNAQGNAIFVDDSGYIYVGGIYYDSVDFDPGPARKTLPDHGNANFFVAKYSSAGDFKWVRGSGGPNHGDAVNGVVVDNQGNVYITGGMHGTTDFNELSPGTTVYNTNVLDGFVAKYDRNGNYLWSHQINGSDGDPGSDIQLDAAGNVYVCGYTGGAKFTATSAVVASHGNDDAFIAKYTSAGSLLWAKTVGGSGADYAGKIAIDKAGNILLSGSYSGTLVFDAGVSGASITANGANTDAFIAKYNSNGGFLWGKGYGGRGMDKANAVSVDDSSNVYVGGYFSDTIRFTPSINYVAHPHALDVFGALDMFMLKLKSDGTYTWSKAYGANGGDQVKAIWVDPKHNIHFTGFIGRTTIFDPGPDGTAVVNNPNPNDLQNTFFCKYSLVKPVVTSVNNINNGTLSLQAFPNPVNDEMIITRLHSSGKLMLTFVDMSGRQHILPYYQQGDRIVISTNKLAPGIYFVRCVDEHGLYGTVRMVKTQ